MNAMSPLDLLGEIERQQARVKKPATIIDLKKELADNVYPLLRLAIESMAALDGDLRERVTLAEGVIAEYLTSQESMVLPELAARIQGTFAIGMQLCDVAEGLAENLDSEIPALKDLATLIGAYREAATTTQHLVEEVTLEEMPEEPGAEPADAQEG